MTEILSFRDRDVWQLAMDLVIDCYALTERLPDFEIYALRREARGSAISIPSNIAEGHNRRAPKPYRNHVNIALGSQAELETQLEIAVRLQYVEAASLAPVSDKLTRVGQMLFRLQQSLKAAVEREDGRAWS